MIWRPPLVGLVGNAFAGLNYVRISVFVVIARGLKNLVGEDDRIHQAVGESGGLVGFSVIRVKGCGAVVAQQPLYASSLSKQPGVRGYPNISSILSIGFSPITTIYKHGYSFLFYPR